MLGQIIEYIDRNIQVILYVSDDETYETELIPVLSAFKESEALTTNIEKTVSIITQGKYLVIYDGKAETIQIKDLTAGGSGGSSAYEHRIVIKAKNGQTLADPVEYLFFKFIDGHSTAYTNAIDLQMAVMFKIAPIGMQPKELIHMDSYEYLQSAPAGDKIINDEILSFDVTSGGSMFKISGFASEFNSAEYYSCTIYDYVREIGEQ